MLTPNQKVDLNPKIDQEVNDMAEEQEAQPQIL